MAVIPFPRLDINNPNAARFRNDPIQPQTIKSASLTDLYDTRNALIELIENPLPETDVGTGRRGLEVRVHNKSANRAAPISLQAINDEIQMRTGVDTENQTNTNQPTQQSNLLTLALLGGLIVLG